MALVEKRWADLVNHRICGKFFIRAISFKPETGKAVKAALDVSFRAWTWTSSALVSMKLFTLVTNSLTHWLTHWLTDSCLVNFIDVTLACEDANSKLVDVVTVADDDRVGTNLLQIWKPRFGQKAKCLFRLWAKSLVKILKLKFRQNLKLEFGQFFSADVL